MHVLQVMNECFLFLEVSVEPNFVNDALLFGSSIQVLQYVFSRSNGLGGLPNLPGEPKGVHVTV